MSFLRRLNAEWPWGVFCLILASGFAAGCSRTRVPIAVQLSLRLSLPALPVSLYERDPPSGSAPALVLQSPPAPISSAVALVVRLRGEDGVWQERTLQPGESSARFEVIPGKVDVQARFLVGSLLPSARETSATNPSAVSALSLIRERACASPADVAYLLAQGETSGVVSEDARSLTLAVGALRQVPILPGGALVQERTPSGVMGASGVRLVPLDPQWQAPLPSACAQRALGEATTNAAGVASLLLPVFPGTEGPLTLRYLSPRGSGQVNVPRPSPASLRRNLHRITLEGNDLRIAQVEASRDPVLEFGTGFFAELTGPVEASEICQGTVLLGVVGTATCDASPAPKPCSIDGETNCLATNTHRAAAVAGLASKVLSTASVAGESGTATCDASPAPKPCSVDGETNCLATTTHRAAAVAGLATKVLSTASVAGESGTVVLPALSDVRSGVSFGSASASTGTYAPDFPEVANVRAGDTVNGAAGALADCAADGATGCVVPASGTIKAADTANFNGWDIRKKRNQATGAVLTFAGLAGQSKTCRNRANTGWFDNATAPSTVGLDVFDTIDDWNNNLTGLPGEIPAWSIINSTDYGVDYACGGIYATGNTATGNTGADASLAHDANGNWQDLTPGILPGGANSTNTANGCNATDKHCVFKELISGLMVTEISAGSYTWVNALNYCHTLGESGHPVVALRSPIPVIGAFYTDWRLPTQRELMHIYQGGIRGLNQTSNLTTFFGTVNAGIWSSSTDSGDASRAWDMSLNAGFQSTNLKTGSEKAVCVR